MQLFLEILSGARAGQAVPVAVGKTLYVGRNELAHVAIMDDDQLATAHFALEYDGKVCRLRELGGPRGTTVNGNKVQRSPVRPGDTIVAGRTTFALRDKAGAAQADVVPATQAFVVPKGQNTVTPGAQATILPPAHDTVMLTVPPPAAAPPTGTSIHDRVLEALRRERVPLYALLDAARDPRVLRLLQSTGMGYQSLYEGAKGRELAPWGPVLTRLNPRSDFVEQLVREAWGNSWGVYLTCPEPYDAVRKHLRHFLLVKLEGGRDVYFRFYDPRVLRVFLPTCTPAQLHEFFGPVQAYLVEGDSAATLLQFRSTSAGLARQAISLERPGPLPSSGPDQGASGPQRMTAPARGGPLHPGSRR